MNGKLHADGQKRRWRVIQAVLLILTGQVLAAPLAKAQTFHILTQGNRLSTIDMATCEKTFITNINTPNTLTDIAFTPDGKLWGVNGQGQVYEIVPANGNTSFEGLVNEGNPDFITSLVGGEDGLLYSAGGGGNIYAFNPEDGTGIYLGNAGYGASGDLTFANGQLVMAAYGNQMVTVDLENLSNSTPLLSFSTSSPVFGVVTIVEGCDESYTYASSSDEVGRIYAINFETETLTLTCQANERIYGAASELEFRAAAPLRIDTVTTQPSVCFDADGEIQMQATSGNGGLRYSLDGAAFQSSNLFTGLAAGNYTVYVEDSLGCSALEEVEVRSVQGPEIVLFQVTPTTCGLDNGQFAVSVEGGVLPLTYSIDGGNFQGDNTFENLPAGVYSVTVRDGAGCTDTDQVVIPGSGAPPTVDLVTDFCQSSGVVLTVNAIAGTPPYEYALDNGAWQSDSVFTELPGGQYTLRLRDAEGCATDTLVELADAQPIQVIDTLVEPVRCAQPFGRIQLVFADTSGLQYQLNGGPPAAQARFDSLTAGTYNITVESALGCTLILEVTVPDAQDGPVVESIVVQPTSCGEANGQIEVELADGQPPYRYALDNLPFQDSSMFSGLPGGSYRLQIEDAQGCRTERLVEVAGSMPLRLNLDISPCGAGRSTISVSTVGGSGAGLQFQLDENAPQVSPLFDSLDAGNYTIRAVDSDGCTATTQAAIPEAIVLALELGELQACGPGQSAVTVNAQGGTTPLSFQLNGGASKPFGRFEGLSAGTYTLQARDANGCLSDPLQVALPAVEPLEIEAAVLRPDRCGNGSGQAVVSATGGTLPYRYVLGAQQSDSGQFDQLAAGNIAAVVQDSSGCLAQTSLRVPSDCPVYAPTAFSPNGDGRNDQFVLYSGLPYQVQHYRIYNRWGGLVYEAEDFSSLDIQRFWDGQYASRLANAGLYVYQIEVINAAGERQLLHGEVMLVR